LVKRFVMVLVLSEERESNNFERLSPASRLDLVVSCRMKGCKAA